VDTLHQGVFEALRGGPVAPFQVLGAGLLLAVVPVLFGGGQEVLGAVGGAVEDHVLHQVAELPRHFVVHLQLAGVDDAHGQAGADGVVEEHRVDRLPHPVVAPARERHIADAAGNQRAGQAGPDPGTGVGEISGVGVVFIDGGGHGAPVGGGDDGA